MGIQVDEDQISGAGNEVLSVSVPLIDLAQSKLEGSSSQQVHSSGHFTTLDDGNKLNFVLLCLGSCFEITVLKAHTRRLLFCTATC